MSRAVRRTDQRPPKFQVADSSLCQMRRGAKDYVYPVCTLVSAYLRHFAYGYVHRNYLASAVASDYGRDPRWLNRRHCGARIFYPRQRCYARHCLLPFQAMRPNPAVKRDRAKARSPLLLRSV
jgi:hypothetical protein